MTQMHFVHQHHLIRRTQFVDFGLKNEKEKGRGWTMLLSLLTVRIYKQAPEPYKLCSLLCRQQNKSFNSTEETEETAARMFEHQTQTCFEWIIAQRAGK